MTETKLPANTLHVNGVLMEKMRSIKHSIKMSCVVIVLPLRHGACFLPALQGIEQLKKEERRWAKKSVWMNLKVVFGHPFSIAWFNPLAIPEHGKADLFQYIV